MSRSINRLVPLFLCSLFLLGCQSSGQYEHGYFTGKRKPPPQNSTATTDSPVTQTQRHHIVKKGETLYSIAWRYRFDVRELARWNNLGSPYTIYPRQKLTLVASNRASTNHATVRPTQSKHHKDRTTHQQHNNVSNKPQKDTESVKIRWQWPTKGKIIGRFATNDRKRSGLNIAGSNGQSIYAAANGDVVYSGGLRGYGKLIIIKHSEKYLSAYAHNNKLLVKEGQRVKKGQKIANMGRTGTDKTMLHFEVRRNGKPVNPLHYLPKQH